MQRAVGRLRSVNVGVPRTVQWCGKEVTSAIWKEPVSGVVTLRGDNIAGDDQADRRVHGGPEKAVYAYAMEDYRWWASTFPTPVIGIAGFGENLTTEGLDITEAIIGERWEVGSAILQVTQPRFPCYKLGMRVGDARFVERFEQARRPGAYLRIAVEGNVRAGDRVVVVGGAEEDAVRVIDLVRAEQGGEVSGDLLERIAGNEAVPQGYRLSALRRLSRRR